MTIADIWSSLGERGFVHCKIECLIAQTVARELLLWPCLVVVISIVEWCLSTWYAIVNHGNLESLQVSHKASQTVVFVFNFWSSE